MVSELRLSGGQRSLWFINQSDSAGTRYIIPIVMTLRGRLDRTALHAALVDVVERQESLRTVFPIVDGSPRQRIVPMEEATIPLPVIDCDSDALPAALREAIGQPFDLTVDLPMRAWLYTINAGEHVLQVVLHHIASDAGSMRPLMRDLSVAYTARCAGAAPSWAPLAVRYTDYTLRHNEMLGTESDPDTMASRQLAFWRKELANLSQELTIPTDRSRPAVPSYRGGMLTVAVNAPLHQRLADLARTTRTTLFMVLQAALATLLSRLGAGPDVPIGTPVSGRVDETLDSVVGFFVNSVVLRTDTSGNPTFRDLLARVRDSDIAAFRNKDLAFDRVVEELNPERSRSRHPLFQVLMTLRTDAWFGPRLPGLEVTPVATFSGTANFDLSFDFVDKRVAANHPDGIDLIVIYSKDLFDAESARRLSDRLLRILNIAASNPDTRIGRIDLLDPIERARILNEWNKTSAPVRATTLPRLFAEQVARTPDRVAVTFEGTRLTYAELDSRATRLARALVAGGAGPRRIVAVALPRSVELIVAIYAVHKAGAAYLPIEAAIPPARIESIVSDAKPVLTLTAEWVAAQVDEAGSGEVVLPEVTPEQPAYVIYTSGSTGQPKGVVISHTAIVNRLSWMRHAFPLGADDHVLHKTPISFDVSVWELFWPLLAGARLVVAKPDGHKDPEYLAKLIDQEAVTVAHFVPSMLDIFIGEPAAAACGGLRTVICSGEALSAELARRWSTISQARLWNLYGPTEAAVDVTSYEYRPTDGESSVPIGRPVWNTRVYVLDEELKPVPPGVPGELYLAGAQLATGYLNRPGLTGERFVASPYGTPGERLFRTGDVVRWRSDGNLEFLGRNDDQVKIRGVRVELGEITSALVAHEDIASAATIVRDGRVLAYVVPSGPGPADPAALRRHVSRLLPDYMVPAAIVPLDSLPLTANGKLDRLALPDAEVTGPVTGAAPRTPHEVQLCRLFADVLGLPAVSVDDNFFAMGGHSLLAMRLVAKARDEAGIALRIDALFETPTVAGLAAGVDVGSRTSSFAALLPLRGDGGQPPLFCLPPAAGIGWVYSGLIHHLDGDQPVYGLQSRGLTDPHITPSSLHEVINDHVEWIQAVQPNGPYRLLGWSFGAIVAYAVATRLQSAGERVSLLALLDGYPSPGQPPALDDSRVRADLLASLGYRPTELTGDGLLSGLGPAAISALTKVFAENRRLAREFEPDPFYGDVLFFAATADKTDASPTPAAWRPHVRGRLRIHEIACAHGDLMRPGPLAEIGATLTAAMRRLTTGPDVVLAGTASDSHTWNLVFLQLMLEELGYRVTNLGPCVPDRQLVETCRVSRPSLIVLSTVNGHGAQDGARVIPAIRQCPELIDMPVVIGGMLGITGSSDGALARRLVAAGFDAVFDGADLEAFRSYVADVLAGVRT